MYCRKSIESIIFKIIIKRYIHQSLTDGFNKTVDEKVQKEFNKKINIIKH